MLSADDGGIVEEMETIDVSINFFSFPILTS